MDLESFKNDQPNAFSTIDADGFSLLSRAVGRKLTSAIHGRFIIDGEPSHFLDGDIEFTFEDGLLLTVTSGHAGVRVFPDSIYDQEPLDGIGINREPLEAAMEATDQVCKQIDIALEPAGLYGKQLLTAGLIF